MGKRKHVVYVRITHDKSEEVGTGPMPPVLLHAAKQLGAEPHVIRVNLKYENGHILFDYWGVDEVEAEFKSDPEVWNAHLLRGKTMDDYLRMTKGKINRLDVTLDLSDIPTETADAKEGNDKFKDCCLQEVLRLAVDKTPLHLVSVRLEELIKSTMVSGEYSIPTCNCGHAGCAGIDRDVEVIHDHGLVLWRGYGLRPRRIFIFDQAQYREAVLKGAREFIELYRKCGADDYRTHFERIDVLEIALHKAEGI
jgi:hypothetical protein